MESKDNIEKKIARLKKSSKLPGHIAIIMDGNGRWARRRHLPRIAGHRAGRESVRVAVRTCAKLGIKVLSLYTFSLENWKRPKREVNALMRFLRDVLYDEYEELNKNNIRLTASGRLELLPEDTREALEDTIERLSVNSGMILNLCLSYSGRAEIIDAVKRIVQAVKEGSVSLDELDEGTFKRFLYLPELPYPDLLIRTSGEYRISNFLLWQIAYTEIVITDVLWPDFREEHLISAIGEYMTRERRFGMV